MKRYFSFLFIISFFLITPYTLLAQANASVNGYVRDATSGEPLLTANMALKGTTIGTSSNQSGYYTINGIKPGSYTLLCSFIGYKAYTKKITLKPGEVLRLDIELSPEKLNLGEVVVRSKAEKESQNNIGMASMPTALIKQLPPVFETDVFRSLQLLPGIKSASDFSSGLYIRGGSPDQTLILLDQTTVYNPTHFFGFFSTFNPDAIKDVRLYKGTYPAEYGGRLGSVVDISNKDGNRKQFESTVSLGLLASRLSLEGPYSKGSWMVAVRRSTLEPLLAFLRTQTDNIPNKFYFWDFNGKINLDASKIDKFSLGSYAGIDYISVPFANDASIRLNYGNQTGSGTWTHIFSSEVFSHLIVTGSRYFNYPTFSIATTPFDRSNNVYDFSLKGDLQYLPNTRHQFKAGFWAGSLTLKLIDSFNGKQVFYSRIHSRYASAYIEDTWRPAEPWKITGGFRLDSFSAGNYLKPAPRISVEYHPIDPLRLQAAYGRYYQFLTLVTNEAFSGFDVWLTTGNGVAPSWGDQWAIGIKTEPFNNFEFNVENYYRTMRDLFQLDPFLRDAAGINYARLFRIGNGYAYGTEVMLRKQAGRFNGYLAYAFSVSRRKYPDINNGNYYPPKYDREHDLKLVLNYRLSRRWQADLVFQYATGQAYTKPLGRTIFQDPFGSNNLDVFTVGRVNASRLPAYNRMDIGFSRNGTFFNLGKAKWDFQVINVYSYRNTWFYRYNFNKNPIEMSTVSMLPILPSVSYTVNFK